MRQDQPVRMDRLGVSSARDAGTDGAGVGAFAGAHGLGSLDVVFLTSFMYRLSRSRRGQGLPSTAPPMSSIFPPSPLPLAERVGMVVTTATESLEPHSVAPRTNDVRYLATFAATLARSCHLAINRAKLDLYGATKRSRPGEHP